MQKCVACGATITLGASDCASCGKSVRPEPNLPVEVDNLDPTDGLLGNLWEGNYSLVKTYWLFGTVGGLALTLIYVVLVHTTKSLPIALLGFLVLCGWQFFISVAIWRSSTKYNGASVWKILAKVAVIVGALRLVKEVLDLFGGA